MKIVEDQGAQNIIINPDSKPKVLGNLKSKWALFSRKRKLAAITFIIAIFLLPLVVVLYYFTNSNVLKDKNLDIGGWERLKVAERTEPFFKLEQTSTSIFGITPQEEFKLTTKSPTTTQFLNENIESSVPVEILQVSSNEYKIIPTQNIREDQSINIALKTKDQNIGGTTLDRNYGWTFQSQPDFEIESTIPGNKALDVPVTTGIEFKFNQDGYGNLESYILIEPKI